MHEHCPALTLLSEFELSMTIFYAENHLLGALALLHRLDVESNRGSVAQITSGTISVHKASKVPPRRSQRF